MTNFSLFSLVIQNILLYHPLQVFFLKPWVNVRHVLERHKQADLGEFQSILLAFLANHSYRVRPCLNKTKQNKTKQNKTNQNKTKQNKTKQKTQVTAYSCKDVKQGNQSFIVSENTHWYNHSKPTWWFSRKLEIVLCENSTIPLHNITRTRISLCS